MRRACVTRRWIFSLSAANGERAGVRCRISVSVELVADIAQPVAADHAVLHAAKHGGDDLARVGRVVEDGFTPVAAIRHRVNRTGLLELQLAGHDRGMRQKSWACQPLGLPPLRGRAARARHRRALGDSVSLRPVRLQHRVAGEVCGGMPAAGARLSRDAEWGTVEPDLRSFVNPLDQTNPPLKEKNLFCNAMFQYQEPITLHRF